MKWTVLEGIARKIAVVTADILELFFRLLFFIMPVGLYYLILQLRTNSTPAMVLATGYINSRSTWMRIAPGVMVVCVEGKELDDKIKSFNLPKKVQSLVYFLRMLAYLAMTITCAIILYFMLFKGGI